MRRSVAAGFVGILLAITAAAGPASANACGCGAVVTPSGLPVSVVSESAVITYADGVESIDYSLALESEAAQSGIIVPTPSPATVTAGDPALLDAVQRESAPRLRTIDDWWGTGELPTVDASPRVLESVTIGGLEATTLAANDVAGLGAWLADNGFVVSAETSASLGQYVAQNWSFVAIKVAAEPTLTGTVDPIRVSFATPSLVYPVGMSRADATGRSMRLYVLGENRAAFVQSSNGAPLNAAQRTVWAGPTSDASLPGAYLTVTDIRFDQPAAQITSDIAVVAAGSNDPVNPTVAVIRPIELLGFPLGTLLVVWGGIGVLLLAAAIVGRVRPH
jgi:hypothetical protein